MGVMCGALGQPKSDDYGDENEKKDNECSFGIVDGNDIPFWLFRYG